MPPEFTLQGERRVGALRGCTKGTEETLEDGLAFARVAADTR